MSDGEKLGKVRAKLAEVTELIDAADQRKVDAKHSTVEAIARLEKNEVEVQSSKRRITLLGKDLVDAKERSDVADGKLKTVNDTADEVEETRGQLETKENDDDERIQKMEEEVKEMKRQLELNETKFIESDRKATVVKADIERIREKANVFTTRVSALEEIIQNHGKSLEELESKEGEAGEREEMNEEKMRFLETSLKETTVRAEVAERGSAVAERNILETENEINTWIQKREEIEKEMVAMDDVADDPSYKFQASQPKADGYGSDSGRTTPGKLQNARAMFDKASESEGEGDRPGSKASQQASKPTSVASSKPESEAEQSETEASEGEYLSEASEKVPSEKAASEKASESEAASATEEESEEEEDDDYFK